MTNNKIMDHAYSNLNLNEQNAWKKKQRQKPIEK